MGIFSFLRRKRKAEDQPKTEEEQANQPQQADSPKVDDAMESSAEAPTENAEENSVPEAPAENELEPETKEEIKLPEKRRILGEAEDPFSDKEKAQIFTDNADLVDLYRRGVLRETEVLRRHRAAVVSLLEHKNIDEDAVKSVLDAYEFYFKKELEEAKCPE